MTILKSNTVVVSFRSRMSSVFTFEIIINVRPSCACVRACVCMCVCVFFFDARDPVVPWPGHVGSYRLRVGKIQLKQGMSTPSLQSIDRARAMHASAHFLHEHTSANNYENCRVRPIWRQNRGANGAGIGGSKEMGDISEKQMKDFERKGQVVIEVSAVDVIGAEGLFGDQLLSTSPNDARDSAGVDPDSATPASVPNTRLLSAFCVSNCECWHLTNEAFAKILLAQHTHAKNFLSTSAFSSKNQRMAVSRVVRNHQRKAESMAEEVYRVQLDHIKKFSNFTLGTHTVSGKRRTRAAAAPVDDVNSEDAHGPGGGSS